MKKIKILYILNTASFSGAENVVINIILNGEEFIDGIYVSRDGSIREKLEENFICFCPIDRMNVKNIKKVIKNIKPDIIHAHDFTAGIVSACSTIRIPIINHLHNNSPWLSSVNYKSIIFGVFCTRYRKILTVSESVMNEFIFGKLYQNKTEVVGNPIDLKKIEEKAKETCEEDFYDVAFLGRLTEQKNPLFFIEIIKVLKKRFPAIKVVIIGDGEQRPNVEKCIEELGLQNSIKLCGFLSNPYPVLNKCKILCMPSKWEGFGLAAVEALALGKPVFAASVGGLVNIINSECGALCDTLDKYVIEIEQILSNPILYEKKSRGALKRANELQNIDDYMCTLKDIYDGILRNEEK